MVDIFISYRRTDTRRFSQTLALALGKQFEVYLDIANEDGGDFRESIKRRIKQSGVVLVVIGPNWMTDGDNGEMSPSPNVSKEIEFAYSLGRRYSILPVLIKGTDMPAEKNLPKTIQRLHWEKGFVIDPDADLRDPINRLTRMIKRRMSPWRRFFSLESHWTAYLLCSALIVSGLSGLVLLKNNTEKMLQTLTAKCGREEIKLCYDKSIPFSIPLSALTLKGEITETNCATYKNRLGEFKILDDEEDVTYALSKCNIRKNTKALIKNVAVELGPFPAWMFPDLADIQCNQGEVVTTPKAGDCAIGVAQ